jgi:hypothetical protein
LINKGKKKERRINYLNSNGCFGRFRFFGLS